ncbi:hypothetical protein K435DRAFT_826860 [Dendrothele bispora CBS 962.96]|uniref:DUF6593 domain-containing protein n=1 Tax=Dendrothele bispora (strain CBS 962.96) TaxID=1314807 RepID=A0A4S8MPA4_DENBC|nr:hypothetical protein K435DRAFT_826860 [Dendrothele bispora CBS 962.96]
MATYGLPYFLEDKTGKLTGSDFTDIHDRLRLTYRRTTDLSAPHTAYMIYNTSPNSTPGSYSSALIALAFGPNNDLGTVSFSSKVSIPMKKYLMKVSSVGRIRKFVASDGQEYFWSWRSQSNQEWTCTNVKGYLIAYYSLKTPGEPQYESSGCSLTVEEAFGHLAPEMLASLMIMRHIHEHNL